MTTVYLILFAVYILVSVYILYIFNKNDKSIEKTVKAIKKQLGSCCVKNKKAAKEKVGSEIVESFEENGECENPGGLKLDICLDGASQTKEDMILRQKLRELIDERNNVVIDGGIPKKVIPLEATVILTKRMSPLVDEDGNISVSLRNDNEELLSEVAALTGVELQESGDVLDRQRELIGKLRELNFDTREIVVEGGKVKKAEALEGANGVKNRVSEEKPDIDSVRDAIISEEKVKEETAESLGLKEDGFSDTFDPFDEIGGDLDDPFSDLSKEMGDNDLDAALEGELDSAFDDDILSSLDGGLEEGAEEKKVEKEENREEFYCSLKFKSLKGVPPLNKDEIIESVQKVFENPNSIKFLMNNLLRTTPLIFEKNKESFFVPQECLALAFFKLYGLDSKSYLDSFRKFNRKNLITFYKTLGQELSSVIVDTVESDKKEIRRVIVRKEDSYYYSFGFDIESDALKQGVSNEDYYFVRSHPFSTEYEIVNVSKKEKLPKLVSSPSEAEINC